MSRPEISTDFLQMKNKVGFPDSNRDRHRLNSYRRDICNSESTFPKPLKPLRIGKLQVLQKTEVRHGADSWVTGSKSVHRIIGPQFSYISTQSEGRLWTWEHWEVQCRDPGLKVGTNLYKDLRGAQLGRSNTWSLFVYPLGEGPGWLQLLLAGQPQWSAEKLARALVLGTKGNLFYL